MKNYIFMCRKLNINYKKDLTVTIVIELFFILGAFFLYSMMNQFYGIVTLFCGLLYLMFHFMNLKSSLKQLTNAKEIAFNGFYRYIVTLLKNNNVLYGALQASLEYVDDILINDVNELISDIENDTSIEPFFKFMENFDDEMIKQLILLLYKTQEVGIINHVIESINECITQLQDTSLMRYLDKETSKIQRYYIFPIALSAIVMILVTIFIFMKLGEVIYV
ncbi:MAG: hypothetical protein MR270_05125 [Erysipelotrichaceae bacterium]|nr:hypothetical protein [Erysipelotrichaceae bacterium]